MAEACDHAVVIGAGIAGLLAARALEGRFGLVTVLDRDTLPDQPVPRVGVPQGRHTHRTLGRGRQALEELFPGLSDDLVARGAAPRSLGATSPLLEWSVRRRLVSSPQVRLLPRTAVLDLLWDPSGARVAGVRTVDALDPLTTPPASALPADLVVDATGRDSRLSEWLRRGGHAEPVQQVVRVDLTYVTRRFRGCASGPCDVDRADGATGARQATVHVQEGGAWSVSLVGYHGDRPPLDLDGFVAAALSYGGSRLHRLVEQGEPLDDGTGLRFPANRWWRYDRVAVPPGVLAVGDAVCTLDPLLGNGTTLAALEALALRDHVPAEELVRRTTRLLARPWTAAVERARRTGVDPPEDRSGSGLAPDGPRVVPHRRASSV